GTKGAIAAALFHLFNHSAFKGSLFLVTGMIDHSTGTRDVTRLRGLAKAMPFTAALCGLGALSMAGLPPFNGFLSKEMFFESAWESVTANLAFLGGAAWAFPALALVGSTFTFVYSLSIFFKVFYNGPLTKDTPHEPHEASWGMLFPAAIMASFIVIVAIIPGFFAKNLLNPAVLAVAGTPIDLQIAFWHGINAPLLMTLAVVGVGLLLYWRIGDLKRLLFRLPAYPGADAFYKWLFERDALAAGAGRLTNAYMTGRLRDYSVYILIFFLLAVGGSIALAWSESMISFADLAPVNIFEFTLAVGMVIAAIVMVVVAKRLPSVLALGVVGYGVALFFVFFRAPDLALTQLLVETVSLLLFLLAFRHLPRRLWDEASTPSGGTRVFNMVIAGSVGVLAGLLTLISHSNREFESICWYYIKNSRVLAGGDNVVNVILVDFRGLDTMGEISVLGLAALGVFALIHLGVHGSSKEKADGC
ncbi:MAG: DUF4040 domain-containing protein, partial [Clostridiales bacterium]|nr:DUF4040 domain-containing protein [Clostridiales bacterium]